MADTLDLTGEIAEAIDGAVLRGRQPAIAYVDDEGNPAVSFRGSTHVHGPEQLAIWVRKRDSGLAAAIAARPQVHLVYFSPDGPGPRYLSLKGRAHADPSANDAVYDATVAPEQALDPEREGIAVIIDVDSVDGFAATGPFRMERSAG
jgi:hypothetical protein